MGIIERLFSGNEPKKHLHYIPSFNDLNTGAAEDLGSANESGRMSSTTASPSTSPPNASNMMPDSNKLNDGWPAFEGADIHKVNKQRTIKDKRHLMEVPKEGDNKSTWNIWDNAA